MSASIIILVLVAYLLLLMIISRVTAGKSRNSFYNGNRQSPWYLVAFGMIGASLSGVTFISVPGLVGTGGFNYLQFVMGNVVGYWIIAFFLLPFYYRKNVLSIYSILDERFGSAGRLTASGFFILSKLISAAFRLFLAASVIHTAIASSFNIPFEITVLFCLAAIWLYTYKGGIKTIVWTDTVQTLVLLFAVVFAISGMVNQLNMGFHDAWVEMKGRGFLDLFNFDVNSSNNFFKQFVSGIVVTLAINGFDQDIVQKNLTCKSASQARKNMVWFSMWFLVSVAIFMLLGALMYLFADVQGIDLPANGDQVFPILALNYLGSVVAVAFVVGISAAAFSSADSAATALTTAFCIDFLHEDQKHGSSFFKSKRSWVHLSFVLLLFVVIVVFQHINQKSVVESIFTAAGYTYGPILGLFLFAFFAKRREILPLRILPIAIASPVLTFLLTLFSKRIFPNYQFGFELIVINTFITVTLLLLASKSTLKK